MIISRSSLALRLIVLLALLSIATAMAVAWWWPCECSVEPKALDEMSGVTVATPKSALLVERPSGESIDLADVAPGKPVAIVVMKGTWCGVCRGQLVRLEERIAEVEAAGAVVVGMTDQPPAVNLAAAERMGISIPILSDADGDAILSFGLEGPNHPVPGVVFVDRDGKVADVVRGRYPGQPQEDWIVERLTRP